MSQPRWGRVAARPHEFLIQIRDGKVRRSGQGASCFKLPGDSVAIVPTSIAKLSFVADQVTREKTGIEVTGLAVYRIVDPMLAYRMLELDRSALTEILRDMFVGATRRIVAGLTLEECLTHRKERLAASLMNEIAPVLGGEGAAEDSTATGWGVVIDTIEIQNVRILSQEVFSRLQAPYREELAQKAMVAKDEVERERQRLEAEERRRQEATARALMQEEEARLEAIRERERAAQRHRDELEAAATRAEAARIRERAEAERLRAQIELETRRESEALDLEMARENRALGDLSQARLEELMLRHTMPKVARAFRDSFDHITVTAPEGDLFGFLSAGLEKVMDVGRAR